MAAGRQAGRQGRPAACGKIKPFGQTCMQPTRKYVRRRCSRRVAAPTEPTLCLVGLLPCAWLCSHYVLGSASTLCWVVLPLCAGLCYSWQSKVLAQTNPEGGNPIQKQLRNFVSMRSYCPERHQLFGSHLEEGVCGALFSTK